MNTMQILLGFGLCLAYGTQLSADPGTFNQRFGVNGYLTSLPLYYKDNRFYSKYKHQDKSKRRKTKQHTRVQDQQGKSSRIPV